MDYNDVRNEARKKIGKKCKVCPECNGIACRGQVPGMGGKGSGSGFIRNFEQLKSVKVRMDTLYEPSEIDAGIEIFGRKFKYPFFAAPIGGVKVNYGEGHTDTTYSEAVVKGCFEAGTAAFTGDGIPEESYIGPLDAVGEVSGCGIPTIKPWDVQEAIRKVKLAEKRNVAAIAMDVDAAGLTVFAKLGKPLFPQSVESLKQIIESTELPFIVKGIMTVEGALKAKQAGASGIIVSNHGGRVLDDTLSTIEVLPSIVEACKGEMKIFIDGGFRKGTDIFKAIALGADAVLIGRPYGVAVYGGGIEGAKLYTEKIGAELEDAMRMTGAKNLVEITIDKVEFAK